MSADQCGSSMESARTVDLETLVPDIYALLGTGKVKLDEKALAAKIAARLAGDDQLPCLRMSNFTTPDKQLWFYVNRNDLAEPLPPYARFKFIYGDIIEELALDLVEQAGHKVECRQLEVEYHGIKGHIDAIVDGRLLDVKSANSRSFQKFRDHGLVKNDVFGYLDQVSLYARSLRGTGRLQSENLASFLAVDKELGHFCLDTYPVKEFDYAREIERKLEMLANPVPPDHCCDPVPHGTSGNLRLGVRCSYNPFKFACHPELRVFQYSTGPVFLTKVVRVPDVPEITREYDKYRYEAA